MKWIGNSLVKDRGNLAVDENRIIGNNNSILKSYASKTFDTLILVSKNGVDVKEFLGRKSSNLKALGVLCNYLCSCNERVVNMFITQISIRKVRVDINYTNMSNSYIIFELRKGSYNYIDGSIENLVSKDSVELEMLFERALGDVLSFVPRYIPLHSVEYWFRNVGGNNIPEEVYIGFSKSEEKGEFDMCLLV